MVRHDILVNDVRFKLKIHKHRQDSGELTLTVVFKRIDKHKSPNFFYLNNGSGLTIFRMTLGSKFPFLDEHKEIVEIRGVTLRQAKLHVVEYLLNNKLS